MNDNEQDIKITKLETNQTNMAEKIDDLKKTVLNGFKDIKEDINCFKTGADEKYASKLTERIVYSMVGILLLGILYEVINIVIK